MEITYKYRVIFVCVYKEASSVKFCKTLLHKLIPSLVVRVCSLSKHQLCGCATTLLFKSY